MTDLPAVRPGPSSLAEAITPWLAAGWRLEALTPSAAVLVLDRGGPVASRRFHLVNAAATLATCGFWLPVWVVSWAVLSLRRAAAPRPRRRVVTVDADGKLSLFELS